MKRVSKTVQAFLLGTIIALAGSFPPPLAAKSMAFSKSSVAGEKHRKEAHPTKKHHKARKHKHKIKKPQIRRSFIEVGKDWLIPMDIRDSHKQHKERPTLFFLPGVGAGDKKIRTQWMKEGNNHTILATCGKPAEGIPKQANLLDYLEQKDMPNDRTKCVGPALDKIATRPTVDKQAIFGAGYRLTTKDILNLYDTKDIAGFVVVNPLLDISTEDSVAEMTREALRALNKDYPRQFDLPRSYKIIQQLVADLLNIKDLTSQQAEANIRSAIDKIMHKKKAKIRNRLAKWEKRLFNELLNHYVHRDEINALEKQTDSLDTLRKKLAESTKPALFLYTTDSTSSDTEEHRKFVDKNKGTDSVTIIPSIHSVRKAVTKMQDWVAQQKPAEEKQTEETTETQEESVGEAR